MQYQMEQAQEELQKKAERLGRLTEEKRQLEKQLAHLEEEITGYKVSSSQPEIFLEFKVLMKAQRQTIF